MRDILFRGKRADNGEWAMGYLSSERTIGCIDALGNYEDFVIDPATVGQYTGMTDKHWQKIFEGDILDDPAILDGPCGVVKWFNGAFVVVFGDIMGSFFDGYWEENFEIVGNIYDNPELLREG